MKVIHVITRLILGGAQENTLYNCEDLVTQFGDEVILATGPAEGPEGDLFERAKKTLAVELLPELKRAIDPATDFAAYRQLRQLIRKHKPDVVHTHSSKAGIVGRLAAYHEKVPAILHTIHGLPFHPFEKWWKNAIYIRAEKIAAKRCHRIICVADAMTEQAVAVGVASPSKFVTIYSGMEVEPFLKPPRSASEVRRELGLMPDDLVIGKVARLFEFKGHDDVLEACVPLAKSFSKLKVVFVGGGIWRDRLEKKARDLGIGENVLFTGLVPSGRIPELLAAFDVVVHASYREGLARVLPQAFLAGKPVVSYDVDGAREVVIPGETGYLVKVQDTKGLENGMSELLGNPAKRLAFGLAGRELCRERFRHQRMTELIRREYEDVLAGKHPIG